MRAVEIAVGVVAVREEKRRRGRWKAIVEERQRSRKKRYCISSGHVLRGEEETGRGLDFSMRAQVR